MFLFVSINLDASIKFSERLEEYSLENGLKVILIEDKRSPAVVTVFGIEWDPVMR